METKPRQKSGRRSAIGKQGEAQAAAYLLGGGFSLLGRNVRTPHGEIDLIVQKQDLTVFVEVKTRTSLEYGYPETSLTKAKQAHFLAAIQFYIQQNPGCGGDWRADVIAIRTQGTEAQPEIVHFENVLSE